MDSGFKQKVWQHCLALIDTRIQSAEEAMEAAQEAANQEGKSSAGDKYETTRALMQRERAQKAQQLAENQKIKKVLLSLESSKAQESAGPGALVRASNGYLYLGVGLGKITVAGQELYAISGASPVGKALSGKKAGDSYELNGRRFEVLEVI